MRIVQVRSYSSSSRFKQLGLSRVWIEFYVWQNSISKFQATVLLSTSYLSSSSKFFVKYTQMGNKTMSRSSGNGSYKRKAYHAGSWYDADPKSLNLTLQKYMDEAARDMATRSGIISFSNLRAVIVPHAGYRFSGPTAAYSYHALQQALAFGQEVKHVLVIHPAHHVYLQDCAVSGATVLETPLGNLPVDDGLRKDVLGCSPKFSTMDAETDNEEHSGEMQYPYLAKILLSSEHKAKNISVLPIMCGALSDGQEATFGELLAPIIARPEVICIISSDFCHYGSRFRYQPQPSGNKSGMPLHEFIKEMDHQGMGLITMQRPGAFAEYLKQTRNTICGRHAIAVWMQAVQKESSLTVNFVKYAQSSAVQTLSDSSVSYASAIVTAGTTK